MESAKVELRKDRYSALTEKRQPPYRLGAEILDD